MEKKMSEKMLKKEREFVVPGEKLVESMEYLPGRNCFREGDSIYAKKVGIFCVSGRVLSVIGLNGVYMPMKDDMIVGEVKEIQSNGWVIDVGAPYHAYLPLSGVRGYIDSNADFAKIYDAGDVIYGRIKMVTSTQSVHVSMFDRMCRKFSGGRIIHVNPAKVPRIIGKSGSMIDMIKRKTGCRVIVGQNGMVWIEGESDEYVIKIIRMIEENSHIEGLTGKIEKELEKHGPPKVSAEERGEEKHEKK